VAPVVEQEAAWVVEWVEERRAEWAAPAQAALDWGPVPEAREAAMRVAAVLEAQVPPWEEETWREAALEPAAQAGLAREWGEPVRVNQAREWTALERTVPGRTTPERPAPVDYQEDRALSKARCRGKRRGRSRTRIGAWQRRCLPLQHIVSASSLFFL